MSQVMLEEAGSQLADLTEQANSGEEVIIIRNNAAVAKIVPVLTEEPKNLRPGFGSGKYALVYYALVYYALVYMADDFDAPLEDFKDYM